ncbi:butyrophilin subfamily 2 member A2-like isoform X1 [Ranitomeya imitator]|uniref:butyrophilin subfamily 2 member A2-like isoform X1 n=1 Tax=Ranitomeya imitator TaxID=111125 RepID=UPI0037E7D856
MFCGELSVTVCSVIIAGSVLQCAAFVSSMQASSTLTLLLVLCTLSPGLSGVIPLSQKAVSPSLYGTVTLPCHASFVDDVAGLTMIWMKKENKDYLILYKRLKGKENLEEQDPRYAGRIELSMEWSRGNLDLTLRNVSYEDEGSYFCRAANAKGHGDKMVTLSIGDLDATYPTITLVTEKRQLKCQSTGVYYAPQIQWITPYGKDLSQYGSFNVTDLGDGRKKVESVLEHDIKAEEQVLCHIREGRLKRSTRGIISDGIHSVTVQG